MIEGSPDAEGGAVDLLVAGATLVATVDDADTEIAGGWVAISDGVVVGVGGPGREPGASIASTRRGAWSRRVWSTPTTTFGRTSLAATHR